MKYEKIEVKSSEVKKSRQEVKSGVKSRSQGKSGVKSRSGGKARMKWSQEGKNEEMKKARMNRRIKEMKKPRMNEEMKSRWMKKPRSQDE